MKNQHRANLISIGAESCRAFLGAALLTILAGCGSLLPSGRSDTLSVFGSFEEAAVAVQKVVVFHTESSELKALGFDPVGRNVVLIPYPEITARLAPYSGVPLKDLDPGIRQCIEAQSACRGYQFRFEHVDRRREGNFWLDFLNIRRVTNITGWSFDALIVESNGQVLFRSSGGQARIDRVERLSNPLGPFQPAGESAGRALLGY